MGAFYSLFRRIPGEIKHRDVFARDRWCELEADHSNPIALCSFLDSIEAKLNHPIALATANMEHPILDEALRRHGWNAKGRLTDIALAT